MRRGTQSAIFFGYLLFLIRTEQKKSMREIAEKIGAPAATVSQTEKGQRALKEPKIKIWASALSVKQSDLTELWWLSQGLIKLDDHNFRVFYNDFNDLGFEILTIMNRYIRNQEIDIPKIEKPPPVTRRHYNSSMINDLEDLIKLLQASERNLVRGYIQGVIDSRTDLSNINPKQDDLDY